MRNRVAFENEMALAEKILSRLRPVYRTYHWKRNYRGQIWIDVGANRGDITLPIARQVPSLTVWAFEPAPELAAQLRKVAPSNFHVIEAAVAEEDGATTFHMFDNHATHSLLEQHPDAPEKWPGGAMQELQTISVQTVRLDTFLREKNIRHVHFLKIDAQGTDLNVVRSLGERLTDVARLSMEVTVAETPQYLGSGGKEEALEFMSAAGFKLVKSRLQTHDAEEDLEFENLTRI